MAVSTEFLEFATELFETLGPVSARRMFGGAGLFCDGVMFGLIAEDVIYLKVDETLIADFQASGAHPFVYDGKAKPVTMRYWSLPEALFDDPDDRTDWARRSLAVARASKAGKPKKRASQSAPPSRKAPKA